MYTEGYDGISSEQASVSYTSVIDSVHCILQLSKGSQLVKLDLKQVNTCLLWITIVCMSTFRSHHPNC